MKSSSFGYLIKEGARNIYANRMMSIASIGTLVACLLLIGSAVLFSLDVNNVVGVMESQNEVVAFLYDEVTDSEIEEMTKELEQMENVQSVRFISKEEGLTQWLDTLGEDGELLESFYEDNFVPNSYSIKVKDLARMEETVKEIQSRWEVEKVNAPYEVASTLTSIKNGVYLGGSAIVLILGAVSLIIIANTIKIKVFNRRKEINIMKFVGATDSFIRLPFVVEGLILGLVSATIAFLMLWAGYGYVIGVIAESQTSWVQMVAQNFIVFKDIALPLYGGFALLGIGIGVGGSMVFVRKHLRV